MVQQGQTQKCSNSSSGSGVGGLSKSSKKLKQKKVPQRGLGVAQLEKIRIEEQQRKDAAEAAAAILPPPCPVSPSKSSYLPLPIPNFHHSNQPSSPLVPLPSGSPADFRLPLSLQNMDIKVSNAVLLAESGDFEAGCPSVPVPGHGNLPKLWNSQDYDFEKESLGLDPGLAFLSSMSLPCESNPIWPLPNWTQRTQQYQHPYSSMVNVSSGTLSTPVLHYSMEPPSNQNYSSSCVLMQPEEKMTGLKRSYPFSLDVPPASSFNFKLPAFTTSMKTNETTSCGSGTGLNFDAANNSTFREAPSCSTSNSEPNSKKSNKENENFDGGDFLTLAPPTPTSCPTSKFKSTSIFPAFPNHEYPDFESLPCQGITEDQIPALPGYSQFNQQQQPLYSFFPPASKAAQIVQPTTRVQNCNGEVGESVDLNLKL